MTSKATDRINIKGTDKETDRPMPDSTWCIDRLIHVAVKYNPSGSIDMKSSDNGIVYYPRIVFLYDGLDFRSAIKSARSNYFRFFNGGNVFKVVSIYSTKGPGELLDLWKAGFDIKSDYHIGSMLGLFKATEEQAKALLEDLVNNPTKYMKSN